MSFPDLQPLDAEIAVTIPDPWAAWPWERRMNPFHERVKADSRAWIASFKPFSPEAQAKYDRCDFCVLGGLGYPDQDAEQLRMTYDLLHLTWVYDDWTDHADEQTAHALANSILDALGASSDSDGSPDLLGMVTGDFWKRLTVVMPEIAYQQRFVHAFRRYLDGTVQEAQDRERGHIRSLEDFFVLRRCTAGTPPFWVVLLMGLDIPDAVLDDPRILEIETLATDMVIISNVSLCGGGKWRKFKDETQDMLSYRVEQARGDMHNVVGILTQRDGLSVQEAMNWADRRGQELMAAAQKARAELPSFGERVDRDVRQYVTGLCDWVRACDDFSFEGQRYFGEHGREVQKHRRIILPKRP